MKGLIALLVFSGFNSTAQIDSSEYKWRNSGFTTGFYATFANLKRSTPLHTGPFIKITQGTIDCRYHEPCNAATLFISSEVKQQIFPLEIKYVYDGTDLFVIYKTNPSFFGRHVEINLIQNSGRFCFFERIVPSTQNGVKPGSRHLIIDLKTDTILQPSKKTMALLFKDNTDLLKEYNNDPDKRKLLKYLIKLNERLGY